MEDQDDGFSLDEMGSDEDHDDMDMRDEWMNDSGEAAAGGRNIHTSLSTSHVGDGGMQITGRQKGVNVVKSASSTKPQAPLRI